MATIQNTSSFSPQPVSKEIEATSVLYRWLLALGFLVGAGMLLIMPLAKPVWTDELVSILRAHSSALTILSGHADDTQPPLHFFLLHLCLVLFGNNLAVFRFVSALPAAIALWFVYRIGTRFSPQVALLAVWLTALSPAFVLFNRMARYHGLLTLLTTMSVCFALQFLDRGRRRDFVGYVLATFCMLMSYYLSLFVIIIQAAIAVLWWRKNPQQVRRFLGAMVLTLAVYAPWFINGLLMASGRHNAPVEAASMSLGVNGFLRRAGLPIYDFCVGETVALWNWPVILVGVTASLSALVLGIRALRVRIELMIPLVCIAVVFLSALATSGKLGADQTVGSMAKRVEFVLPLFYLTLSVGILSLRRQWMQIVLIVLLMFVSIYSLSNYWRGKQFLNEAYVARWDLAIQRMQTVQWGNNTLIFSPEPALHYYLERQSPPVNSIIDTAPTTAFSTIQKAHARYIWVVGRDRGDQTAIANTDALQADFSQHYREIAEYGIMPRAAAERRWMQRALKRPVPPYYITLTLYDTSAPPRKLRTQ